MIRSPAGDRSSDRARSGRSALAAKVSLPGRTLVAFSGEVTDR